MAVGTGDTPRDRLVAPLTAALGEAAGHGGTPRLVRGPWAAGTSWVLRRVVAEMRRRRRPVTVVVGDGRPGRLERALSGVAATKSGGGVLVIDDTHLLDTSDADLLRDLILNGSDRLLLGARSPYPVPDPLEWLVTSGAVATVNLDPLDDGEAAVLAAAVSGGPVQSGTVHRLNRFAGGRAGLLTDLVVGAVESGSIVRRNGLWRQVSAVALASVQERLDFEHRRMGAGLASAHHTLALAGPTTSEAARELVGDDAVRDLRARGHLTAAAGRVEVVPPVVTMAAQQEGSLSAAQARRLLDLDPAASPYLLAERRLAAGDTPSDDDLVEAARSRWAAGDPHLALDLLSRAKGSARALRLEADLLADIGDRQSAIDVLTRLEAVADAAGREAAASERATITMWLGQRDRALAISRGSVEADGVGPAAWLAHALLSLEGGRPAEAAEVAEPLTRDEATAAPALSIVATAAALRGDGPRGVELAEDACRRFGGVEVAPDVATITLVLALGECGDLDAAGRVAEDGYQRALGASRSAQAWMALCRLRIALFTGDLVLAQSAGLEAAELFADLDHHAALRWALAGRLLAASALGDAAAAAALDGELDGLGESGVQFLEPDVLRARGWARVVAGDLVGALEWVEEAVEVASAADSGALAATALHDLVRIGYAERAVDPLGKLLDQVNSRWMPHRTQHAVGRCAGDPDALLEAAAGFRDIGAQLLAREAAADAAKAAHARGDRGAERRANAELRRLPEHAEVRTPSLVGAQSGGRDLTRRERQVAGLAASGATNRAIAAELGVSLRTVENLLHRAYHKLGIDGRGDLAQSLSPIDSE